MEKKPDFEQIAVEMGYPSFKLFVAKGCERIWTDYVTPLQSQNERILSALKEIIRFKGALGFLVDRGFQYPDNCLKAFADAEQLINEIEKQFKQ